MSYRVELLSRGLRRLVRLPRASAAKQTLDFDQLSLEMARGLSRRAALQRLLGGLAAGIAADVTGWFGLSHLPSAVAQAAPDSLGTTYQPLGACNTAAVNVCLQGIFDQLESDLLEMLGEKAAGDIINGFFKAMGVAGVEPGELLLAIGKTTADVLLAVIQTVAKVDGFAITLAQFGTLAFNFGAAANTCVTMYGPCPAGSRCSSNGLCCPDITDFARPLQGCGPLCCGYGLSCCDGQCTDTNMGRPILSSATGYVDHYANCGGCGPAFDCNPGETCFEGACACGVGGGGGLRPCNRGEYCVNGVCQSCPNGQAKCNGDSACVDTLFNNSNCGGCAALGSNPQGADCLALGGICCSGQCVDALRSDTNCGGCGNFVTGQHICTGGQTCQSGSCQCPEGQALDPTTGRCVQKCSPPCASGETCDHTTGTCKCGSEPACMGGQVCVGGTCQCPSGQMLDPASGQCVRTCTPGCGPGETCDHSTGMCRCGGGPGCSGDQTCCGGTCVSLSADPSNCGACGHTCSADQMCMAGQCMSACPDGQTRCGNACVTLGTEQNCRACGDACPDGQPCVNGKCQCPSGQTYCPSYTACGNTFPAQCVDLVNNINPSGESFNCGTCGFQCYGDGTGDPTCCGGQCCPGNASCEDGRCICPPGTTLCTSAPNNGCSAPAVTTHCADLRTEGLNCGACGRVCNFGYSPGSCVNGTCTYGEA